MFLGNKGKRQNFSQFWGVEGGGPELAGAPTVLRETFLTQFCSGVRKRVVSKRVILEDVPCTETSSQKTSFPAVLPWQKKAMIFDVPGLLKPERGYIRQNHPFPKPPFCFLSIYLLEILP